MKLAIKTLLLSMLMSGSFVFVLPGVSSAQLFNDVCNGSTADATVCQEDKKVQEHDDNSFYGPNGVLTKTVELLSVVIGIAAVIMIIIGGLRYVLSSGDPNSTKSAQNTILFAIIGIVIALLGQVLIRFVINRL